jgi:O-antigen ligase
LAGSRAAVAAVVLTFAFAWVIAHRPAAWKAVGAAGLLVGFVVVLMGLTGRNISAGTAFGIRADLTKVALDLTATSPVFGIGLSNFRLFSPNVIPDDMRRRHGGFLRNGENAHNNFLQILPSWVSLVW